MDPDSLSALNGVIIGHGGYSHLTVGKQIMRNLLLPLGLAWIAQGLLLYWAYGFLSRFAADGAPKDYAAAGRPGTIRGITRIFRRFAQSATALVLCGAAVIVWDLAAA